MAERRLGDRIMRSILRDPDVIDDPMVLEYVNHVWTTLLASARRRGEIGPAPGQQPAPGGGAPGSVAATLFVLSLPSGRNGSRMASSRLRRQQATRCCSRRRSLPTVWLSVTQIPSGRLTPSAGVW